MNDGRTFRISYPLSFQSNDNFIDYKIPNLSARLNKVKFEEGDGKKDLKNQSKLLVKSKQQLDCSLQTQISPEVFSKRPKKKSTTSKGVFSIGNTIDDNYQWKLYVKEGGTKKTGKLIRKVEFFLPKSDDENHVVVSQAPFTLVRSGSSQVPFDIPIVVHLVSGKQLRFNHMLQFEKDDFSKEYEVNYIIPDKSTLVFKDEKVIKDINFPLDCLGEVLTFIRDSRVALNVLLTSKSTQYYMERENPACCENIVYYNLQRRPTTLQYLVSKLDCTNWDTTNKCLSFFPNLKELTMSHSKVHDVGLNQLRKLEILRIRDCLGVKGNDLDLPNLREFSLRLPYRMRSYRKDSEYSKFKTFTNLEVVELIETVGIIGSESFKNLKKIRILKLNNVNVSDDLFDYLPNIVELDLDSCSELTAQGFGKNKFQKLKILKITNCRKIETQKEVEEALGNNTRVRLSLPGLQPQPVMNFEVMTEQMVIPPAQIVPAPKKKKKKKGLFGCRQS